MTFRPQVDGRQVAIKKVGDVFSDLVDAKRIVREIKLLRHFDGHENIIAIADIMTIPPDTPDFKDVYIVTNLMESDMDRIIASGQPLTDQHFQYFIYQACSKNAALLYSICLLQSPWRYICFVLFTRGNPLVRRLYMFLLIRVGNHNQPQNPSRSTFSVLSTAVFPRFVSANNHLYIRAFRFGNNAAFSCVPADWVNCRLGFTVDKHRGVG